MNNYSSRKLELLALTWAITDKFRDFLLGAKFTVYTDNNPLCFLQTSKLTAHEQRWLSKLASFDFGVKYRQAKHTNNADALSRMHDKLELTRSEDVKTLLQNFAVGTVIPGEIVSNTQTQSVEAIYSEESFITFPSLSIQKNYPVIDQFVEIWKTKLKPSTAEQRTF